MKYISPRSAAKISKIIETNFSQKRGKYVYSWVLAYRVPIVLLPYVQLAYRSLGISINCRFRGPRNHPQDTRHKSQRNQDCIKKFATHFTVYKRD